MWLPISGFLLGILLGSIFTFKIPIVYAKYMSVALLAGLDSVLGGIRGAMEERFNGIMLLSGFFVNAMLAALLTYTGDHLGMDLAIAAYVAFGVRIFQNLAVIRRYLIDRMIEKHRRPKDMYKPAE